VHGHVAAVHATRPRSSRQGRKATPLAASEWYAVEQVERHVPASGTAMSRMIIAADPRKASVTIEAVDGDGTVAATGTVGTDARSCRGLLSHARRWPHRVWAVEGTEGAGRPLTQRLLADGERTRDVPAELAASTAEARRWYRTLAAAGISAILLTAYDGRTVDAVKIGTFERGKGLDFVHVLVPDHNHTPVLRRRHESDEANAERAGLERRRLHVAIVRARDTLWLGTTANPAGARV
jgi:hypothetical protein